LIFKRLKNHYIDFILIRQALDYSTNASIKVAFKIRATALMRLKPLNYCYLWGAGAHLSPMSLTALAAMAVKSSKP